MMAPPTLLLLLTLVGLSPIPLADPFAHAHTRYYSERLRVMNGACHMLMDKDGKESTWLNGGRLSNEELMEAADFGIFIE